MKNLVQRLGDRIGSRWCYVMHPDPMWPVNGKYECPRCQRKFPVPWDNRNTVARDPITRPAPVPKPVLLDTLREVPGRVHAA